MPDITVKTQTLFARGRHKPARRSYEQELGYRKQIARQLLTQYVDGINSYPVTLKSKLRVTEGHSN